jgi:hypothetical protein
MSLWLEDTDTGEWETLWAPPKKCGGLSTCFRLGITGMALASRGQDALRHLYVNSAHQFSRQMMAAYEADDYRIFHSETAEVTEREEPIYETGWGLTPGPAFTIDRDCVPLRTPGMRYLQPLMTATRGWDFSMSSHIYHLNFEFYAHLQMTPGMWIPTAQGFYDAMFERLAAASPPRPFDRR